MKDGQQCRRKFLAGAGHCLVEQCTCGAIHMRLGDVSLRITEDSLETITTVLVDASLKVREQRNAALAARSFTLMQGGLSGLSNREEN